MPLVSLRGKPAPVAALFGKLERRITGELHLRHGRAGDETRMLRSSVEQLADTYCGVQRHCCVGESAQLVGVTLLGGLGARRPALGGAKSYRGADRLADTLG